MAIRLPLIASIVALVACGHEIPTAPTASTVSVVMAPVPPPPPTPLSPGSYEAIFTADSVCTDLPEAMRTRTYSASIGGREIAFSGAVFGSSPPHYPMMNVMYIRLGGDAVTLHASDPPVLERPTEDSFLMIEGSAEGTAGVHRSDLSFRGAFMYCAASKQSQGSFTGCLVDHITCRSENHRLTLTRR